MNDVAKILLVAGALAGAYWLWTRKLSPEGKARTAEANAAAIDAQVDAEQAAAGPIGSFGGSDELDRLRRKTEGVRVALVASANAGELALVAYPSGSRFLVRESGWSAEALRGAYKLNLGDDMAALTAPAVRLTTDRDQFFPRNETNAFGSVIAYFVPTKSITDALTSGAVPVTGHPFGDTALVLNRIS